MRRETKRQARRQLGGWAVLMAVVIVGLLIAIGSSADSCKREGGVLVRGIVWYECVGGTK